jgi:molybdopterin-guanine dinucleotide biosynthesis protein B
MDDHVKRATRTTVPNQNDLMRIFGLAGWSGAGKTSLLAKLIPHLTAQGLRVSTLKHAHAAFDIDVPGKDSHTHRMSGATEVLVSSPRRFALIHELRGAPELELPELLRKLSPVDLVLVEGYKRHSHPKLEIYRAEIGKDFIHPNDPEVVAIASDTPLPGATLPVIDLNDVEAVAAIVLKHAAPVADMLAVKRGS